MIIVTFDETSNPWLQPDVAADGRWATRWIQTAAAHAAAREISETWVRLTITPCDGTVELTIRLTLTPATVEAADPIGDHLRAVKKHLATKPHEAACGPFLHRGTRCPCGTQRAATDAALRAWRRAVASWEPLPDTRSAL